MGLFGDVLKGIGLIAVGLFAIGILASLGADTSDTTDTGDQTRAIDPGDNSQNAFTLDVAQYYWERDDWVETWGLVENPTDTWVQASSVTITYLDENGDKVQSSTEEPFRTMLAPGQATPFEDMYPDQDVEVRSVDVTAHAEPREQAPSWHGDLQTDGTRQKVNSMGNYDVQGNLTNTGDAELAGATVHIALFNQDGDVVNVREDARNVPTDLSPGETQEFRFVVSNDGDVAGHELYTDAAGTYS